MEGLHEEDVPLTSSSESNSAGESSDKGTRQKRYTKTRPRMVQRYRPHVRAPGTAKHMFPDPSRYFTRPQMQHSRNYQSYHKSQCSLSKRPLKCPSGDCQRYLGVSSMDSHFYHDHKNVPQQVTDLDTRTTIKFQHAMLELGVPQCLIFLTLKMENHGDSSLKGLQPQGKICFVLSAARVYSVHLDVEEHLDLHLSLSDEALNEKTVVWLASNVTTSYSYTVAISSLNHEFRVKYYGPLHPLSEIETDGAEKVCKKGLGLVLTKYHLNAMMSEAGDSELYLDVLIHGKDEEEEP